MRLLYFLPVYVPAWKYGGPILSVSRLCEGLLNEGVEVRVITTNAGLPDMPASKLGQRQYVNGVSVFYYPVDQQSGPIKSKALELSLHDHLLWADLLHLSSIWQPLGIPVQTTAHALNVPVIQTLRGALSPYSWTRSLYKKLPYFFFIEYKLLQRASAIQCTTHQEIAEISWLPLKAPIKLLPNPLDLSKLYSDHNLGYQWRLAHSIPTDQKLFVVAGRLHHKKGLDLLPPVLKTLESQPWQLLVIGDDDGAGVKLRNRFDSLGLSHRCHWISSVPSSDLLSPLNAADFLLLPSRHENFGNIVVEALSCGCGVITSDCVGVNEMLSGCPGFSFAPRTISAWSKLLSRALSNRRPGKQAEMWVRNLFSKETISRKALSIYQDVLRDV